MKPADEPFFPKAGNRGYDASYYEVDLNYDPATRGVKAETTMYALPAQALKRFSLDFFGPKVTEVRVNGKAAGFSRGGGKLTVVPKQALPAGEYFTVAVSYSGVPPKIVDPDGTSEGWYPTDDGVLAVGEPRALPPGCPATTFPATRRSSTSSSPSRKRLKAVANGRRHRVDQPRRPPPPTTGAKPADEPVLGGARHRPRQARRAAPSRAARPGPWSTRGWRTVAPVLAELPEIVRFEQQHLRSLPVRLGRLDRRLRPKLGYALESQTPADLRLRPRPDHGRPRDRAPVVRRLGRPEALAGHLAQRGLRDLDRVVLRRAPRRPQRPGDLQSPLPGAGLERRRSGTRPPGHPGTPRTSSATSTYIRGGMALEALRLKIGTKPMLRVLRDWAADHRYGNGDDRRNSSPSPRASPGATSTRSSTAGSTGAASPETGLPALRTLAHTSSRSSSKSSSRSTRRITSAEILPLSRRLTRAPRWAA